MNISEPFIHRPVATTLLTVAIAIAGGVAYNLLPVSPLPQVDFPTINVQATLPGASPETMASSVATPLERQFGRIAAITEMTSTSTLGGTGITLQFDLNRDINAAAREVEAAINAARGYLPTNLPNNPSYRKVNPAEQQIFQIALTSDVLDRGQLYDAASTIIVQKLSQIKGVGQVNAQGGALPGVRVELNPMALNKYGIGLEQVRGVLNASNSNVPKGHFSDGFHIWEVGANDQMFKARDYQTLIVAYNNSAPVRLSDIAEVNDAVEDLRNMGMANSEPSVNVAINRQPGANIIDTVDRIRAALPQLKAAIPHSIKLNVTQDQTVTIRASVRDIEKTMIISVLLVVMVVFIFLKSPRTTMIPSVAVPVSLIGTFGVMYLFGYSLDNLSLMALTISTGFVVDDAIVVIENITRYLEQGMQPFAAALRGAREIGSTVFTISVSLVAVFIPLLLMGGIVGRLFREFAVTMSVAIAISMAISLTTTPMMCAHLLKEHTSHGWLYRTSERGFNWIVGLYARTLDRVLHHPAITLGVLAATIGLNVFLFIRVPKGFFPQQDNGRLNGTIIADQDTSFQAMEKNLQQMVKIVQQDPAVDTVAGYTGGSGGYGNTLNTARMQIQLKPLAERKVSVYDVIERLRPKLSVIRGSTNYMQANQDVRIGGRNSASLYQFTMRGDNVQDLTKYGPPMLSALRHMRLINDVNSDQQNGGLQAVVQYDRDTAARFGISSQLIDNVLYDAFGQRQVSTMYTSLNQYHVVMEAAPRFWQDPDFLHQIYVYGPKGGTVPLNAIGHYASSVAPLAVNHQGLFPAVTISFNLAPNVALGDAVDAIQVAARQVGLPDTIQTFFAGTAQAYQDSLRNEPILIAAALITVYIVLGMLYESCWHPITILSTLPSAGVGAMLALLISHTDLSIIAMIGIILLIGIVKKNAIMMIDFAIEAERSEGLRPREAIYKACQLRFRPILMTTMSAMLGAMPLALGHGVGGELRRPLGITIIGGLLVSQLLTLYTTPVVYLSLDRLRLWWKGERAPELMHG
ncbi:MAG: efflux RND transporter permease subunit [Bryobacteraceae bacterium]